MNMPSLDAVLYLIRHIFLPPKLPGKNDSSLENETALVDITVHALEEFKKQATDDCYAPIDSVIDMVKTLKLVNDTIDINERELASALKDLPKKGGTILLHIRAQNAGVMISKVDRSICVEAFELSPLNEQVITTKGRLRRTFPGPAVALTLDAFEQPGFQATMAHTLAKMSHQSAFETQPRVKKAGHMHDENRDTTHPKIVTELFMAFLSPNGEPANLPRLCKNTREEVMWNDALLPWRRSPVWMLLRVAMQLVFSRLAGPESSSLGFYKTFMAFLMATVLRLSLQHEIPSDMLYVMNAKLGRRLLKLDPASPRAGLASVKSVMHKTAETIRSTWDGIMHWACTRHDLSILERLKFKRDSLTPLEGLSDFLNSLSTMANWTGEDNFHPTSLLAKHQPGSLPNIPGYREEYQIYNLKAFEDWVSSHLTQWIEDHKGDADTCGQLSALMTSYYQAASPLYSANPEAFSLLILTILELWVACDKSAVYLCELLRDYDPGIPLEVAQSLILPSKTQMERLLRAEDYLKSRQRASRRLPSIFQSYGDSDCFAVRYFNTSLSHQQMRQQIEDEATMSRNEKVNELHRKKERYRYLMQQYEESSCEYTKVVVDHFNDITEQRHSGRCQKCAYRSEAAKITIQVHEWPLPQNDLEAKSTVFELKVPSFFGRWRDTAVFLLLEVLKAEYSGAKKPEPSYPLKEYKGLSAFFTPPSSGQRLTLLSDATPHGSTHRQLKSIASTVDRDVCLQNGLRYKYYDNRTGTFVSDFDTRNLISKPLTYNMPKSSSALQQFLLRPSSMPSGPSPNAVIASQSSCPEHMSLEEYKALCTIPLGYRSQWLNILTQLAAPSVDFRKVESAMVILQSIYQAGPSLGTNALRASHEVLTDQLFAKTLLGKLNESFQRVRENWESSQAVSTFISISARLLSLASTEEIKTLCLEFLHETRAVTFGWTNLLNDKAYGATDDDQQTELLAHAVELALICTDTFNVDDGHLDEILNSHEDGSIFIQCSILIQNSAQPNWIASNPLIPILKQRWKCLCLRSYPILADQILTVNSQSLDHAISQTWSSYRDAGGWCAVSDAFDFWIVKALPAKDSEAPLRVHYNLLTGELLVGGLPLARLPTHYTKHPMYCTLFGRSNLEVMPSTISGMQFSTKRDHAGYAIHLRAQEVAGLSEADLLVRAVRDGRTYHLVPSRLLAGHFPTFFIQEFVHWYNEEDDCVELRPAEDPWNSSADNWKLVREPGDSHWQLARDDQLLVSIKSQTAKAISSILSPLEDISRLHIFLQCSASSLEIELPRLSLAFLLKSGTTSLRSKQFRGFAIDSDQSLETLVGLESRLLLQDNATGRRLVIIPEGRVSYRRDDNHVTVTIAQDAMTKAHAYPVDHRLGRLVDNGTLQSKLWICYLHALTTFCLPDPLLQRTGTEQALFILNSAAVRSFDRLSRENIHVLNQISGLTAGRAYYPTKRKVMQTVKWAPALGFLAQHGGFYKAVKLIFAQAGRTRIFYPESSTSLPVLNHVEPDLLDRDCVRSSNFRVSGFGAEDHTTRWDKAYLARDQDQNSAQASKAFAMSSFVLLEGPSVCYRLPSNLSARIWDFLERRQSIFGPEHPLPFSELNYDSGLLEEWSVIPSKYWCALHQAFSNRNNRFDKFRLMIWLSTLAFAKDSELEIVQTLGSFFALAKMAQISPPPAQSFQPSESFFQDYKLRMALEPALRPLSACPEAQLPRQDGESNSTLKWRRQREFRTNQHRSLDEVVHELGKQWPCECPIWRDAPQFSTYMNTDEAKRIMRSKFKTWYDNYQLNDYLHKVEDAFEGVMVKPVAMRSLSCANPPSSIPSRRGFISIDDIFSCSPASMSSTPESLNGDLLVPINTSNEPPRLRSLLSKIESLVSSNFEQRYVEDLRTSLESLQSQDQQYSLALEGKDGADFKNKHQLALKEVKQWPRLQQDWKQHVVRYALALTELQRAERLISLLDSPVDLVKELRNPGHTNWDSFEQPESLLLEVESGFLIRGVQQDISREMRDVGKNATMQLNMGEGKSSVIVPLVAASLADGSRLVRVITAKPQAKQMFQMLVSKLGGLLNRRVCHLPFSRSLRLGETGATLIGQLCREMMANGDILLVQPEHILSFKLMGLECLITGKDSIGRALLRTQDFFEESSRDIVDESDENFSVRFELIYTMGMQRPVELSPRRWVCIQQVLGFVRELAPEVKSEVPSSMEIHESPRGSFPRTRVLDSDGQERLCHRIAKHICDTGLEGFPITRQPGHVREAVLQYISKSNLSADEIAQVESTAPGGFWTDATNKTLLLLRGLLAGGILSFAFSQKRWRVQYGLDTSRTPPTKLAVPYRAKDSPSLRSEFSHPDVVIVLTCLSYYYGGMTNDDLFLALDHLFKSDQADVEYQEWVKDAPELLPAFRQLSGINLKDRVQCVQQLFPPLRFAKSVIDYFLTHIVFPKEMREFPQKLSTSGWDIGQVKTLPTSGFSGTNDSRMTLPLSMTHLDLPEQKHTNALVLEHLLRPENSVKAMPAGTEDGKSTAESLLDMVTEMEPPAQVILDVGAQIIELSNVQVAREWLKRTEGHDTAQAVVFFNEDDELSVLDRKGRIERLQTSPFAGQLDVCLVFLDESHTRGTDLRLPDYYRAAVTLGANLTKDRLIQACMRMRKLGHGQSVVFCVPEEIKRKILSGRKAAVDADIAVSDVLCWSITETWTDIRRSMPLWAVQGKRFEYQRQLWANSRTDGESHMSQTQAEEFLEQESFSLESRYRPSGPSSGFSKVAGENENLQRIHDRCLEFDSLEHGTASLQEEQERELSPEIVEERQVQRPRPAQAAKHSVHADLTAFVRDGRLRSGSTAFKPAFETLRNTSAAAYLDVSQFPADVLVTVDFATTVERYGKSVRLDTYQRSVQWILTSTTSSSDNEVNHMLIISPYEAENLLPEIRRSNRVTLHLYAPRPNLGIRPIDDLDLYTVSGMSTLPTLPSHFIRQLNLFAGQLYFDSFKEYVEVCTMLGLAWHKAEDGSTVAADGFIIQHSSSGAGAPECSFTKSPVGFLRVFLTKIRKNCEEIEKTHMGAMLGGRLLRPADFGEPNEARDLAIRPRTRTISISPDPLGSIGIWDLDGDGDDDVDTHNDNNSPTCSDHKTKYVPSSGTYPLGFSVSGVHVGVKASSNSSKPDLAFITSDRPAHAAAVFTTNKFQAAPVQVSRSVLSQRKGEGVRSIIINSGCANAVTGERGLQDAEAMARTATGCFDSSPLTKSATPQSLVMSTGVIGQRLPIDKIVNGIPRAYAELGSSHEAWLRAARAIMTTDTFPKLASTTFTLPSSPQGVEYRLAGMSKGAGMIHPNMATLLGVITTDAPITAPALHSLLATANASSFNAISIDGDTSTNDTVAILANGAASPKNTQYITSRDSPDYEAMSELLTSFAQRLAQLVVRDGEGATKFVEIRVRNAPTTDAAQRVAASIARSPLVKTALYGRDANWGRILCAIGYTPGLDNDAAVVPTSTSVSFIPAPNSATAHEGVLRLLVNGEPQPVDEARAARLLEDEDLIVDVDLGTGLERGQYWTCDFSHEYVTINGDYRT
ncbi:hypothetical protein DV735_g2274, partial [Chaetothyriales sp. CBS 134920]